MDQNDLSFLNKFEGQPHLPGFIGNCFIFLHAGCTGEEKDYNDDDIPPVNKINYSTGLKLLPQKIKATRQETGLDEISYREFGKIERFELKIVTQICQHLIWNELEPKDVQVMSNCQLRLNLLSKKLWFGNERLGKILCYHTDDGVQDISTRVTVVVLCQTLNGRTDGEVLFRTIFNAIARSCDGVIIVGHFNVFRNSHGQHQWRDLLDFMFRRGDLRPYISLYCKLHQLACLRVNNPEVFAAASPLGGCINICSLKKCGHVCELACHPLHRGHDNEEYWCQQPCNELCKYNHPCINKCYENCACKENCPFKHRCNHEQTDNRYKLCMKTCEWEYPCGHNCNKKCYECQNLDHEKMKCTRTCSKKCSKDHECTTEHMCSTPCDPCNEQVQVQLHCGHKVFMKCSESNIDLYDYICTEPCKRLYALCHHPCKKKCFEDCGICEVPYPRKHPECGHMVMAPCHERITVKCREKVKSKFPSRCGHDVLVSCYKARFMSSEQLAQCCGVECDTLLNIGSDDCGHYCFGSCQGCHQGRFHQRCMHPCGRILICGHSCIVNCSLVCPPCNQKCTHFCEHHQCPYECGVPCNYICDEPCPYFCPHLKCTRKCGEVCDREGCFEPCEKELPCGHLCVGFCGEVCPPLCRICNEKELIDGLLTGESEITPEHRFIYLPECKHTIEESTMTQWLNTKRDDGEILLKNCPICNKSLGLSLRRYSDIIHSSFVEVDQIKRKIYGDESEILGRIRKLKQNIQQRLQQEKPSCRFKFFVDVILEELKTPLKSKNVGEKNFNSVYLNKVLFIEWMAFLWEEAEDQLKHFENLWHPKNLESYHEMYSDIFRMIIERNWPLHPNEISSVSRELDRLDDICALYKRVSLEIDDIVLKLGSSREGRLRFTQAENILRTWAPYGKAMRTKFKEIFALFLAVQSYTLDITERERLEILRAFGSRTGRWFKCINGHPYVVTECGGVTETSICNVCGVIIGGLNHQMLVGNSLATEMDGAEVPLYPTAMQRGPN